MNLDDFKENIQYKLVPDGLYEMLTSGQISDIKHIAQQIYQLLKGLH